MNDVVAVDARALLASRAMFYKKIRDFFEVRHVIEVQTSLLSPAASTDVHLDSYVCYAQMDSKTLGLDRPLYIHTSPELAMKRLLVAGSGDIYQICQVARGGELGRWHRSCFSMLEWYRLDFDMFALIAEVGDLLRQLLPKLTKIAVVRYQDLYAKHLGIDNIHKLELVQLRALVQQYCDDCHAQEWDRATCYEVLMNRLIEPHLVAVECCIVYDYPQEQAALAQVHQDDQGHWVAKRFEVYCGGIECGNGFLELIDPVQQRQRFMADLAKREQLGLPLYLHDELFLKALAAGLPACSGIAMGLDRLFAISCGHSDLAAIEVLLD